MKWPFISRKFHEAQVGILLANLETRGDAITTLKEIIQERNTLIDCLKGNIESYYMENERLIKLLTAPRVMITSENKPQSEKKVSPDPNYPSGRGGWRQKSRMLSDSTAPKPQDSIQALEQKVLNEGGTV